MTRSPRISLLVLVVVLGVAALMPSGAAAAGLFHSETEPTLLTGSNAGEGDITWSLNGETKFSCSTVSFSATTWSQTTSVLRFYPAVTGCGSAMFVNQGCGIRIDVGSSPSHTEIECTLETKILLTDSSGCTWEFGSQTGEDGGATFTNLGTKTTRHLTATLLVKFAFKKSGTCSGTGITTMSVSLLMNGYQYKEEGKEGAQLGIWWTPPNLPPPGSPAITSTNSGEGNYVLKTGEAELNCETFAMGGARPEASALTLHPTFDECLFLGESATVDTTGCNFVLYASTGATGHGKTEIECGKGYKIKVTSPWCNISFASQSATGGLKYTNLGVGSSRDLTVHSTLSMTFTKDSGMLCFLIPGNTGTQSSRFTLRGFGYLDGPHHEDMYTEGSQKGLWWEGSEFKTE